MFRHFLLRLGVLALGLALAGPVRAQTPIPPPAGRALITAIDAGRFPEIETYLLVQDEAGQPVAGLSPTAFQLTEDQPPLKQLAVLEADIGVQVVVVLNIDSAFKARDVNGVSRWDYLQQALTDFAQAELKDTDDLTVLTPEGLLIAHVNAGAPVADALQRYRPAFTGAADPLALLASGLNYASDVPPRPGMRRVLIFAANSAPAAGLPEALARVAAAPVQVHTIFVGPDGAQATPGAQALRQLAEAGGGRAAFLQGPATLQDLLLTVAAQGLQYRLSYRSRLTQTGQHTLTAQVNLPSGDSLKTPAAAFQLRIEPPSVSLLNPPVRVALAQAGPELALPAALTFSDGHPRALRQVQLIADGQALEIPPTAELTTVTWPLAGYTTSLTHTLQLRVVDELGLEAVSKPAQVFVEALALPATPTPAEPALPPADGFRWAVWGTVVVLGMLLGAGGGVWFWLRRRAGSAAPAAPKTDLVQTRPLTPQPAPARRLTLPHLHFAAQRPRPRRQGRAYLEIVEAGGSAPLAGSIELVEPVLHLGRDPQAAEVLFNDRSVSRRHARIAETTPGVFVLYDEGSASGTWVNFSQIDGQAGHTLQPDDLINLGRVQLRFKVRSASGPVAG